MLKTTATRLFSALLGYVTLIILLMTLNPFYLAWPDKISFQFDSSFDNLILNIVLFLPVGFLYRLITGRRGALVLGAIISFSIETLQLFIPARTTSVIDILANTLGAALGAMLLSLIEPRFGFSTNMLSRMRLETPLMGLTYLLIPLLWIDTLALNEAPYRWVLTALVGMLGAIIFSNLFRHWWEGMDYRGIGLASTSAGFWFFSGVGPSLLRSPEILLIGLGVVLLTACLTALPQTDRDRRFERNTLKHIIPFYAIYLMLLSLWFPFSAFGIWHGFFGFTDRVSETSQYALYPRLEYLAAFTILGFITAEWRGRLELSLTRDLPRLLFIASAVALSLEILSGFQSGRGASFIRLALAVTGSLFGGTIYHLSRAHIRFLLGR